MQVHQPGEEEPPEITEIESLCMNCHEQGVTRLLLTNVPYFRDIVIMAFSCPHCNWRSNEIQSAGSISDKGKKYELKVQSKDLNRQIVKSETATILIPELQFEIPAITQRGLLNTIEGFLRQSIDQLQEGQQERRAIDPETTSKIDAFLSELEKCANGERPFTIVMDDPAGNSFIENPMAPQVDPNMTLTEYKRTNEQNMAIGLTSDVTAEEEALKSGKGTTGKKYLNFAESLDFDKFDYKNEVMSIPGNCANCNRPVENKMIVVEIPYFKEVVIMAVTCDECGYKSNEVKSGGGVSEKGRRITLKVTSPEDLNRSILKSESAEISIPEKELNLKGRSLGGRFTTIEGLIGDIVQDLSKNQFSLGDSATSAEQERYLKYLEELLELNKGEQPFTVILDDPLANSYIQNPNAPDPDPSLLIEDYERTFEQNEELGLNDIKTEGYETVEEKK